MSIASTLSKVTSGSVKLSAVHARMQAATDVGTTARTMSPVESVMRSSPSRLRRTSSPPMTTPSRPVTAGSRRPFTSTSARATGVHAADPTDMIHQRPLTAGHHRVATTASRLGASPSAEAAGRPSTAYAPRRAAQLASADGVVVPQRPTTAGNNRPNATYATPTRAADGTASMGTPADDNQWARQSHLANTAAKPPLGRPNSAANSTAPAHPSADGYDDFVLEVSDEDALLADALLGMQLNGNGARGNSRYRDTRSALSRQEAQGMADDALLEELEAAYKRLRVDADATAAEESPEEAVVRLRAEVIATAQAAADLADNYEEGATIPQPPSFTDVTNPDVLLLWTWSYVEDYPFRFLQEVKAGCCVGEEMSEGLYSQCEAIVQGILTGALQWDLPVAAPSAPSGGGATVAAGGHASNSPLDAFVQRHTRQTHETVLRAVKTCCHAEGMPWCAAAESTWECALQHLRFGLGVTA